MTCGHSGRGSCCGLRGDPIGPFDHSEQMGTEELLSVLECDAEVWCFYRQQLDVLHTHTHMFSPVSSTVWAADCDTHSPALRPHELKLIIL